eukprot:scaffold1138_cov128-Cylindrotheca_fusiformis.AAC.6
MGKRTTCVAWIMFLCFWVSRSFQPLPCSICFSNNEHRIKLSLSAKKKTQLEPSGNKKLFFATEVGNSTVTTGAVVGGGTIAAARTASLGAATTAVTASTTTGSSVAGSSTVGGTVAAARTASVAGGAAATMATTASSTTGTAAAGPSAIGGTVATARTASITGGAVSTAASKALVGRGVSTTTTAAAAAGAVGSMLLERLCSVRPTVYYVVWFTDCCIQPIACFVVARAGTAGEAVIGGLAAAGVWKYFVQGGTLAVMSELLFAAFCVFLATRAAKPQNPTLGDSGSSNVLETTEMSMIGFDESTAEGSFKPPDGKTSS